MVSVKGLKDDCLFNSKTADFFNVNACEIILFKDPITELKMFARASIDDSIPDNEFYIDNVLANSVGFGGGVVEVQKSQGKLKSISSLTIDFEPNWKAKIQKIIIEVYGQINLLKNFLDGRIIHRSSRFYYSDYDINITAYESTHQLKEDEYAILDWEKDLQDITISHQGGFSLKFNNISIIDLSDSMNRKDIIVKDFTSIMGFREFFEDEKYFEKFFSLFRKDEDLQRYLLALLAVLFSIVELRGYGHNEKRGFITFSDKASIIKFDNFQWSTPGDEEHLKTVEFVKKLIDEVLNSSHKGANMNEAFQQAIHLSKCFDDPPDKFIIYTLFSDGHPNNPGSVRNIVQKIAKSMPNVVLNVVGIGTNVDESFLMEISQLTGGEYFQVKTLKELLEIFSYISGNKISKRRYLKT